MCTDEIIALNKKSNTQNTPGRGRGRGRGKWRGRGRGGAGKRGGGTWRGQSIKAEVSSDAHKHTSRVVMHLSLLCTRPAQTIAEQMYGDV